MTPPLAARLSRALVGCHPRRWRQRYAGELLEVPDQHRPTARTVLNLAASARGRGDEDVDGLLLDDGPDPRAGRLVAEDGGAHPDGEPTWLHTTPESTAVRRPRRRRPSRQSTTTITTSAAATDGIAERAPDLRPVLPSGRTSLPVRPVDSTVVRTPPAAPRCTR